MPNYRKAARRAAKKYGVDPTIFERQIQQESGFNPNARSGAGAQGIAQFIPSTAKAYNVNLNDGRATDDLEGAARYMRDNLRKTGGNYHAALSIYNSGRPDAYKNPGFAQGQTYNYVRSILAGRKGNVQGRGQGGSSDRFTTKTTTIPGVDRSADRQALLLNYLASGQRHQPTGLLELKAALDQTQDTPSRTKTTRVRVKGSSASPSSPSSGRFDVKELFWQGKGGIDVKDGKVVPQGFVSGHTDHVHVASGPKQILKLAQMAKDMGLRVGENPAYGGVAPVHAEHSNHYKIKIVNGRKVGEAIDVSGDPQTMAAYARRVARLRKR